MATRHPCKGFIWQRAAPCRGPESSWGAHLTAACSPTAATPAATRPCARALAMSIPGRPEACHRWQRVCRTGPRSHARRAGWPWHGSPVCAAGEGGAPCLGSCTQSAGQVHTPWLWARGDIIKGCRGVNMLHVHRECRELILFMPAVTRCSVTGGQWSRVHQLVLLCCWHLWHW